MLSRPGCAILTRLRASYTVLDETTVSHAAGACSWVVSVLAPA
jgi:hypothetical protein